MEPILAELARSLADRYRIERELGHGGMARVFLTWDSRHLRQVALKVLRPEVGILLGVERFRREITTVARLQHPHIMPIHDSGEFGGHLWFTMPFIAGSSLREHMDRRGPLNLQEALRITHETGQGLQFAHLQGVIHRDIKPENLMLTQDGSVVVADFGIARPMQDSGERLTESGMMVGTPAYMSPEQAVGDRSVDTRTDIYALAVVLYEMLAGSRPFPGNTPKAVLTQKLAGTAPSLRDTRPEVPLHLDRALLKAMAPDAADRFSSISEFLAALADIEGTGNLQLPLRTVAVLLIAGILLAWAWGTVRSLTSGGTHGVPTVLVLPLENTGDSASGYFADGVSDGIRTRLAAVGGVRVIGATSSGDVRRAGVAPVSAAKLVGADYVIGGSLALQQSPGTSGRYELEVSIVRVDGNKAVWSNTLRDSLPGIFAAQTAVVARMAKVLDLGVDDRRLQSLSAPFTSNIAAYDAYLKSEAIMRRGAYNAEPWLRLIEGYERAVALDSNFARAWAQLGRAYAISAAMQSTLADSTASRRAAERAIALAPDQPDGYLALSTYLRTGPHDLGRAREQLLIAKRLAPNNVDVLRNLAFTDRNLGQWESAVDQLRLALQADPRSNPTASELARTLLYLRRYAEVLEVVRPALARAPDHLALREFEVMALLGQGHLLGARRALAEIPSDVSPTSVVTYMTTFYFLYWALSPDQQDLLLRLTPRQFGENRGDWALAEAAIYSDRGNLPRARAYADSALRAVLLQLRDARTDPALLTRISSAYGYLGNSRKVIEFGERAIAVAATREDADYYRHQMAASLVSAGEYPRAVEELKYLLRSTYFLSGDWLRIDPAFAPLRGKSEFETLVTH
jgi:serine/threonine-protein kinase